MAICMPHRAASAACSWASVAALPLERRGAGWQVRRALSSSSRSSSIRQSPSSDLVQRWSGAVAGTGGLRRDERVLATWTVRGQRRGVTGEREVAQNRKGGSINDAARRIGDATTTGDLANTSAIDSARATTKAVTEAVRSALPNLSPRENIYNFPNFLTVSRLIAAPATAYLLLHDHHQWALGLFAYAGITDLVDGWLARRWKLQTVAGSVIDPMADKALMIILTVTLAVKGALPLYLATLILGRDASLAIAAIYYRFASLPSPKTFMRYWDFSLPSAEVHPTTVSKYNTLLQLLLIGSALALPVLATSPSGSAQLARLGLDFGTLDVAMTSFQYLVAATTAWSGLSYAFLKNAVTILGADEALKARQGRRGRAIIGVTFGSVVLAAAYIAATVDDGRRAEVSKEEARKEP